MFRIIDEYTLRLDLQSKGFLGVEAEDAGIIVEGTWDYLIIIQTGLQLRYFYDDPNAKIHLYIPKCKDCGHEIKVGRSHLESEDLIIIWLTCECSNGHLEVHRVDPN